MNGEYMNTMKAKHSGYPRTWMSELTVLFFLAGIFLIMTSVASGQDESIACIHCHSNEENKFKESVHFQNGISCIDCHGGQKNISGAIISVNVMTENFTGVPTRTKISDLCLKCHIEVTGKYKESIHWKELEKGTEIAPTCTDCHRAHDILSFRNPKSLTYHDNVSLMCADCHEEKFGTYEKSYHFKAYQAGGKVLAACSDCHESHEIRPESDPKSMIYQANLASTCGKTGCHPSANQAYIYGGKVHEEDSVYLFSIDVKKLVTYFYIIMILFELAFTFGLIFLGISSRFELGRRH